jgi:hypothetical protein
MTQFDKACIRLGTFSSNQRLAFTQVDYGYTIDHICIRTSTRSPQQAVSSSTVSGEAVCGKAKKVPVCEREKFDMEPEVSHFRSA